MTKEEARKVLRESDGQAYIGWDDERDGPYTRTGEVLLDGEFSKQELLALLVFFED